MMESRVMGNCHARFGTGENLEIISKSYLSSSWEMVIAGHELKRIGKIRKPVYVVPNNITEQFRKDILAAYKDANILVLDSKNLPLGKKTDSESQKSYEEREATRRTTLARIATGDWDFIVISHEMFQRLPMSASFQEQFYNEQIQILKNQQRQITMADDGRWSDKSAAHSKKKILADISKKILKLEQEKEAAINEAKETAGFLPFDELGIDQIFVDESDQFKNLQFITAKENVAGISTTGSKRAWDMYQKTTWLNQQRNGGVVFASGTPVSNTLNEIFTLMRYLIPKNVLKANGYSNFDEWAGNFARYVESVELHAGGGGYKLVQRAILTNLNGLRQITDVFTDYKTAEDMPHLERPKVVGGAKEGDRIQVIVKATETQKKIMESLVERAKAIQKGGVDPSEDNLLKITSEGRKCSIDVRLLDSTISEEESGGKITAVCDNVFEEYKATKDIKSAQVIFLDLGTPAKQAKSKQSEESNDAEDENAEVEELTESDLKLYDIIKRELIRRGIPAKEIAFVHDAGNNAKKRQDIFDKVNEGEIRVILGSTQKMSAGTNFQKHLTALHHLDCPWRPRDVEQREGRILRSGNLNKEVKLFVYLTEDTLDAFNWETIKHKSTMINSFWKGNSSLTEIEDTDEMSVNAADFVAALSNNNPLMKERSTLDRKIQNLKLQQTVYVQNQNKHQSQKKSLEEQIPETEKKISNIKLDIKDRVKVESGDAFRMKLGDTVYEKSTDAKAALEIFLKTFDSQKSTKIGEIGGFDIMARSDVAYTVQNGDSESSQNKVYLQLKNHGSYSISAEKDPIRAMANFINKGIETTLDDMEKILADDKNKLADIEKLLKEPFAQKDELKEAELRLKELDARIAEASRMKGSDTERGTRSTAVIDNLDDTTATENDRLLEKVQKSLGFYLSEFRDNTKPRVSFKTKDDKKITQWNTKNLSEAIACARYLANEHSNSIENVDGLKIEVSDQSGKAFSIDEDGFEETYSEAAEKSVAELDAESETYIEENKNSYDEIENEFPNVKADYSNNREFYSIDGKRVSKEDARKMAGKISNAKTNFILDSLEKNLGIKEKNTDEGENRVLISFESKQGKFVLQNKAYFETFEDAVKAARYIKANFDDVDFVNVSADGIYTKDFLINEGGEHIETDAARERIAKIDAESETELSREDIKTPDEFLKFVKKETGFNLISNIGGVGNLYVVFKFKSGVFDYWNVDNLKTAIACARYLVKNCSEFIKPDKSLDSVVQVMYNDRDIFKILNMNGAEQINGKDAEKAVTELDAESENDITTRAQKILKDLNLDNLRPNKDDSLGKTYGKLEKDDTITVSFGSRIEDAEKFQAVKNIAQKANGIFNDVINNFSFTNINDVATFFKAVRTAFYGKKDKPVAENKKTAGTEIELPQGYKTETGTPLNESNIYDFIVDEDGNKNLGEINSEIEQSTNGIVKAAPIRLQVGDEGFGFIHINFRHAEEIKSKGYPDAISYIQKILQNVNKIYSRADTGNADRFILCSEGSKGKSKDFMPIDLELEKGSDNFYRIITAYPNSTKKIEGILIFDDSTGSSSVTATDSLIESTDDKSGVGDQTSANAKINIPSTSEELPAFDDTPHSSPVTATGSLPRLANDKSGVSNQWGNAKTDNPSVESVSQSENDSKEKAKNFETPPENEWAKNLVNNAIQAATNWVDDHVILSGFSPELGQTVRNEIIKQQATIGALGYVDQRKRESLKKLDDLAKKEDDSDKKSVRAKVSTQIEENIKPENLTGKQSAIVEFSESMGVPVQFFKGDKRFHGAFRNGKIYINADSETSYDWTFWHESFHWMAKNNPALLKEISDAVGITDKQIIEYRTATGRKDLTDAETVEEILADNMKDVATRAGLLQEMGKKNKSLIERIISWLKSVMDKFTDFFNTPKNGLTREQKNKMYDTFGKMARSIVDSNGNAIFRFNNRTKDIELSSGDLLPAVKFSARDTTVEPADLPFDKSLLLPKGYQTESGNIIEESNRREFIVDKNGNADISRISKSVEEKSNGKIKSFPVRLQVGFDKFDKFYNEDGFGYIHITKKHLNEIKKHGFENAIDFIKYVVENFDKAFQHPKYANRIILRCNDSSRGFMPVQLIKEENYYNIVTAYPKKNYNENGELLYDGSETPSTATTDGNTETDVKNAVNGNDKNGGVKSSAANVSSNSPNESIQQNYTEDNVKFSARDTREDTINGNENNLLNVIFDNVDVAKEFEKLQTTQPIPVSTEISQNNNDVKLKNFAVDVFSEKYPQGVKVNTNIGEVIISRASIKDSLGHSLYPSKVDAVISLPEGMRNAAYIGKLSDFDGKQIINHYFVYPIEYEGEKNYVFCRVRDRLNERRFYVHDVFTDKEIREKSNAVSQPQPPTNGQVQLGGTALYKQILTKFYAQGKQNISNDLNNLVETEDNTKYSINASDNSFGTFVKRTANRFFGESNQRERNQMRIALEEITGYKISSGHLGSGEIAVKPNAKVIRTQKAYDWTNILPEVGKIVAQKLNLPASDAMNNYIADWIVDGAPNNVSSEAKEFQRVMRAANDEYREKLLDAQNKFIAWQSKSAMEKAQAIIISEREEPSLGEKFKTTRAEGYAQFFEDIAPVKNLIDEITQETGKKFLDSENPYVAFRNYKGMAGRAKMLIEGNELTVKTLQETYPRINFNGFKTLAKILQEVGADVDDETYDEFKSYVVACHVKEIHEKNKANLAAQKKRQDNIDALQKKIAASQNQEETEELQEKLLFQQKKLKELKESFYVTPLDEKACDEIISQYGKKYGAAQKDLVRYSNTLLAIIHDSGLMGKFVYEGLLDKWKNYVPLHRLFDENEDLAFGDSLKTMQGSARDIIDPIQAIIESTNSFIKRAEKNKAKLLLAGLVRCNGVGRLIEEVDGKNPDDHTTITFYEDGVKKYLQTDEAVVRAVNNLTVPQLNWFSRFLRIGTNIVRNFMTLLNPNFAVRNWARDAQDAFLYGGKYDKDKKIWDVAKEIIQVPLVSLRYASKGILGGRFGIGKLEDDEDFQQWMIHGGAQASFWSMDRDYAQASIEKLTRGRLKNASRWVRIKDKAAQALHLLQMFGEYSELGTRIGHYKKVKEALAKQHGGKNTYNDLVTAAFESRDLMDFARGGASSRNWNVLTAFANAHLQGIDKFRRTFSLSKLKTEEGKKEFGYSVIRLLMSSVVPAMVLFLLNHDEDWYKKDLNDYERRSHWILGENVRVPKGMDFGIRFMSNLTEDFLNWASNNKPVKFTETFINPIKDEIPDMLPTMLQPIIENSMNYDLFTKNPIVPRRLQNFPEHLQYDDRTPSLAKYLGEQFEYSPKKIEHLLFGFTGNIGKGAMRVSDTVVGDKPAAVPPADWLPLIGGFFRIPYRNPRIVNEYYEQLDAQTKWHNEYQLTGKKPAGYNELLFNRLKKIQKEMKNFSKLERAAVENPNLDSAEKDRRQIAIQKKRIALIERFMH